MNLECTQCQARYRIDDTLIPPQGARVRCRRCSAVIPVPAPVIELAPADLELIPPPSSSGANVPTPDPVVSEPSLALASSEPVSEPPLPPKAESFVERFPQTVTHPASMVPAATEFERFPATSAPVLAGSGSSSEVSAPALIGQPEPASPPTVAEEVSAPSAPPSAPPAAPSSIPLSTGTPIPEGLSTEERGRHEKARRLARVLASDIAIYNREKKEQGAREGNLVAVLGYEIKKSWEIYKERVGAEFANGTPYFRDALNDMLAEGKKIF
jgi:predicted Zn finger-like uncharacterized protein